jgi:hypothetical protein
MALNRATEVADRVAERRRTVALARHSRDAEDLSIAQVVQRLGRSPATIKARRMQGLPSRAIEQHWTADGCSPRCTNW